MLLSLALAGQAIAQVPRQTVPPGTTPPTRAPRQEPCWEVAGISKTALHERRAIAQQARQQIEAVCANSSLSAQQKRQQIQQIHERERQQIDGIITPTQQAAMRSCQESRHGGHVGGHGGGAGGPCGQLSAGHKPHPFADEDEEEAPPEKNPHP